MAAAIESDNDRPAVLLERVYQDRERWLAEPEKYCDLSNPMCNLGWMDSLQEEIILLHELGILPRSFTSKNEKETP